MNVDNQPIEPKNLLGLLTLAALFFSCQHKSYKATTYEFPNPVNTTSRTISYQTKQIFSTSNGIFADNDFAAARLNSFYQVNDSLFEATVSPENKPINPSPWYAFRIWSQEERNVAVRLVYEHSRHRYSPKISSNGTHWEPLSEDEFKVEKDSSAMTIKLNVTSDTLWIAAQEIVSAKDVWNWSSELTSDDRVRREVFGRSALGRDLFCLDIGERNSKNKDLIVILSRQHPPEVTGFFAMQHFVEALLNHKHADDFFKQHRVLVYPLLNPDGVDLGHWRHNAGGVDLNRDWAIYNQPETRQVADHIFEKRNTKGSRVILGLDFHSTYRDVYYTQDTTTLKSVIPHFRERWFKAIEEKIEGYEVNERPSGLGAPVTKSWFYVQFQADGITYEIGDTTPRNEIKKRAEVAASSMIELLSQP